MHNFLVILFAFLLRQIVLGHVQSQFTVQPKLLRTIGTMIRVLAQMHALVLDQIVGLGK